MALETLSLPHWHIDCIDPISNSRHDSCNNQLQASGCRGLQNGPDYHDPAPPHYTAPSTIAVSSQECDDCADETADIVDSSNDAFKLSAWIVEVGTERGQADYSAENALVIAK